MTGAALPELIEATLAHQAARPTPTEPSVPFPLDRQQQLVMRLMERGERHEARQHGEGPDGGEHVDLQQDAEHELAEADARQSA